MSRLLIFKLYLVMYFVFAASTIYVAAFTGIKVPFIIEILPAFALLFSASSLNKLKATDSIFFLALASFSIFAFKNQDDLSWINNNEIRNILFISINYFIFRSALRPEWSQEIANLIVNVLKISIYLLLLEFVVINIGDIANKIEAGYLVAFPERIRLYEGILSFIKPIGLYPGTHNAGIAATIAIVYLLASKTISTNKGFFGAAILAFFICFSLTGFITLILLALIISNLQRDRVFSRGVKFFTSILFGSLIYISFSFYDEITKFRSHGEVGERADVPFSESIYITSIDDAIDSLLENPLGMQLSQIDVSQSEVYLSRILMYFGIPMLIFFILACFAILKNLRNRNISRSELFYSIGFLTLFVSSFHYPSLIAYPLNVLAPLAFVFLGQSGNKSVSASSPNATQI